MLTLQVSVGEHGCHEKSTSEWPTVSVLVQGNPVKLTRCSCVWMPDLRLAHVRLIVARRRTHCGVLSIHGTSLDMLTQVGLWLHLNFNDHTTPVPSCFVRALSLIQAHVPQHAGHVVSSSRAMMVLHVASIVVVYLKRLATHALHMGMTTIVRDHHLPRPCCLKTTLPLVWVWPDPSAPNSQLMRRYPSCQSL